MSVEKNWKLMQIYYNKSFGRYEYISHANECLLYVFIFTIYFTVILHWNTNTLNKNKIGIERRKKWYTTCQECYYTKLKNFIIIITIIMKSLSNDRRSKLHQFFFLYIFPNTDLQCWCGTVVFLPYMSAEKSATEAAHNSLQLNPSRSSSGPTDRATGSYTPLWVNVWAVRHCSGWTRATNFHLAMENHFLGFGYMLRRETAQSGENNCHRVGERRGVGKEELGKKEQAVDYTWTSEEVYL